MKRPEQRLNLDDLPENRDGSGNRLSAKPSRKGSLSVSQKAALRLSARFRPPQKKKNLQLLEDAIVLCRNLYATVEEKKAIEPLFTVALQEIKKIPDWRDPFRAAVYPLLLEPIIKTGFDDFAGKVLDFFHSQGFPFDRTMLDRFAIVLAHAGKISDIQRVGKSELKKMDDYVAKECRGWENAPRSLHQERDEIEKRFQALVIEAEKETARRKREAERKARQQAEKAAPSPKKTAIGTDTVPAGKPASLMIIPETARKIPLMFSVPTESPPFRPCFGRQGLEAFQLAAQAQRIHLLKDFDELLCQKATIGVYPHRHQLETARKVLTRFRGRAILADEVGLGKTIEAGMVIQEYLMRGMARRVLILVPPALVGQWQSEMSDKFSLRFATTSDPQFKANPGPFWDQPLIIASLGIARTSHHFSDCLAREYDLVVVDEAHHLRNPATKGHKLVESLKRKFLLLLTATPVQNNLLELFHLINLLRPGTLGTEAEFKKRFINPESATDPLDPDRLRELLFTSMIRNTRSFVDIKLPRRFASTCLVHPLPSESTMLANVQAELRRIFRQDSHGRERLLCANLLEMAGSSVAALHGALARAMEKGTLTTELAEAFRSADSFPETAKDRRLIEIIKQAPDKVLVFTKFRDTLDHIGDLLAAVEIPFTVFHGGMSGKERDEAVADFRDRVPVLVATESGGEGKNLQFCNTIINYDLPWNPMRIEQRIGRLHRIGQTRDVFIFNLCLHGTVEEKILDILEKKINLFELVVGEIDMILGHMKEEDRFEDLILELWLGAEEADREAGFAKLGDQIAKARRIHETVKAVDEALFKDEFEA